MFRSLTIPATMLALLFASTAFANDGKEEVKRYDDHALVRATLTSEQDLERIHEIGAILLSCHEGLGVVDYVIPPESMRSLEESGIAFVVIDENIQDDIDAERARLAAAGRADPRGDTWFEDFKNFDDIIAKLEAMAQDRPDLASLIDIGDSIEGRDIWAIRITGPGDDKPGVLYDGTQHAREWISPMVNMYIADKLVYEYDTDPQIQALVNDVEFFIVPVVNPDGYVYTWNFQRLWRKNRRDNEGTDCDGVDTNRNWDAGWGGQGASGDPCSGTYYGTDPFSEPETAAMRDFLIAHPNVVSNIDFHSYGQLVLSPYGYTPDLPPDHDTFIDIGSAMSQAIFDVHGENYNYGPIWTTIYPAAGTSVDYMYDGHGIFSYTIELRPIGSPGFELPPDQIIPTCEENFPAALTLAESTTVGVLFSFPNDLPDVIPSNETTIVGVRIRPVASGPLDDSSGKLYWRIGDAGGFEIAPMTYQGDDMYEASLPAVDCGVTVEFYFEIESLDGDVYVSPDDAPNVTYGADVFDIDVAFADDFESDLGWTVQNDPGLADGAWDRGVPVDCDRGDPPFDGDGSGQCYLTDNSSSGGCNSDVDDGSTRLISPILDASDPDAVISYRRWYSNTEGDNPQEDTFVIDVSDDGGASWRGLETVGPAGPEVNGGWYTRTFRIADIPEMTNTDQFRIRFIASDLGDGSVVEAGVDAVAIKSYACDEGIVGDLNDDGSVNVLDLLMLLDAWGPCDECPEDLNGDGAVNVTDLLLLLANWG
jgi:murein tripeptide amidase MpaA